MNGSILTNQGAMVALQTMKSINKDLSGVQDMISTGKKVATSKDNAAIWAISSVMESDVSAFKAVSDSLSLGQSTVSVARNAAEQVKDSLVEIKDKIIASQEENVDREKIQADVGALRSQIKSIVGASQFNGLNLLTSSEDLEVLSSLDRSSNGSVTTSTISVESKSLNSGTAANSTAGTNIVAAVNEDGPTITAGFSTSGNTNPATITDGKGTLGTFTNGTQTIAFSTNTALDEGDSISLRVSDGTDSFDVTYTQTATGSSQTTGEELANQLTSAFAAFAARDGDGAKVDVGTGASVGDYVSSTGTYTGAEGTFVFADGNVGAADNLINTLTLSENAGTLTVTNQRDTALTVTAVDLVDYDQTDLNAAQQDQGVVSGAVSLNYTTVNVTGGGASNGSGIQSDDTLLVTIGQDLNNTGDGALETDDSRFTVSITGAALDEAQLAETVELATAAYIAGDISSTTGYTGSNTGITALGNGTATINGATVTFGFSNGGSGVDEATLQGLLAADITVTNGGSGVATFTEANGNDYAIQSDLTIGSTSSAASLDIGTATTFVDATGATAAGTVAAGTIGEYLTIDVNNDANQEGDTLSVTLQGVNLDSDGNAQPITYTAVNGNTPDQIATGFADAINTQLAADGITDVVASQRSGGLVDIKNFNITTSKDVSDLSVVNELTTAAVATDSNDVAATTIAAGETNKVTFAKTSPSAGDTYSVTVGSTTASYTTREGDDLNDVGSNLEGLLKINSSDDITVDFTSVDDPSSTDTVLTVKNNGTSSISSFSATVKSGGTAGGGLELLDDIDVTTASKAEGSLDLIEGLINVAIDAAASYGSSEKRLENQQGFISKLTDSLQSGIGSLVDANLEETSARLQALQVQQQLGTQALSIANQAPQNILSLFR